MPRDQGFTRPKVLLLLPMRNMAYQVVKRLVALAQRETRADSVQVGLADVLDPGGTNVAWGQVHSHQKWDTSRLCAVETR